MSDDLLDQILRTLWKSKKPLKAKELGAIISKKTETRVHRKEINRVLHSDEGHKYIERVGEKKWKPVSRTPPWKRIASVDDAEQAIYIDFEGTQDDPPSLLGVLLPDGDFTQYVFEERLFPAAQARSKENTEYWCVIGELATVVRELVALAQAEDRRIVAWSQYERLAIREHLDDNELVRAFESVFVDARRTAKRWHTEIHAELEIPVHERNGKYSLAALMGVTGYDVPPAFGTGLTGQRIRAVRKQLEKRNGNWQQLTAVTKGKWTKLLKHNYHDCFGMRHVLLHCTRELERATPAATRKTGSD